MAIVPFWLQGRTASSIMTILLFLFTVYLTSQARKGKFKTHIRELPAYDAIEEGIGRATEMNRPVFWATGDKGTLFNELAPHVLTSFAGLRYISELCVKYGAKQIVCVGGTKGGGADLLPYVQAIIDEAYTAGGKPGETEGIVRYIASEGSAYGAGLQGTITRENPAAVMIIAPFGDNMIPPAEAAGRVGAISIGGGARYGGSMDHHYVAFCDYWMICDEYFTFGALLTHEPATEAGIAIGDYTKWVLIALTALGFLFLQLGMPFIKNFLSMG